ncbi:MAG: hypothetical protein LBR65_09390 [Culturomica sp.]|jgi:hypothetical protein|nr:hypothetical protein [Culturomica sp.]
MGSRWENGMEQKDFILEIYKAPRTVFGVSDVAMLFPGEESKYLSDRLRYYVQTGRLQNPRKGIYAKPGYNALELANILYTPSYISLEYVLQQAGVIFQFDSRITSVCYLSREIEIDGRTFSYRRIREEIIMEPGGIVRGTSGVSGTASTVRTANNVNIATPERAFLDILYLNKDFYFDNLNPLDREQIARLAPAYRSAALEKRVSKILQNG